MKWCGELGAKAGQEGGCSDFPGRLQAFQELEPSVRVTVMNNCRQIYLELCKESLVMRHCKVGIYLSARDKGCQTNPKLDPQRTIQVCCVACNAGESDALKQKKCDFKDTGLKTAQEAYDTCCRMASNGERVKGNCIYI